MGRLSDLIAKIKYFPLVEAWEVLPEAQQVRVEFSGTSKDAAIFLRSLILADIPVIDFHCTQEDLEAIFLKLGHQQAS